MTTKEKEYTQSIEQLKESLASSIETFASFIEKAKSDGLLREELHDYLMKQTSSEERKYIRNFASNLLIAFDEGKDKK
jgi:hypothetical protein